jgi:hypothetical protein
MDFGLSGVGFTGSGFGLVGLDFLGFGLDGLDWIFRIWIWFFC